MYLQKEPKYCKTFLANLKNNFAWDPQILIYKFEGEIVHWLLTRKIGLCVTLTLAFGLWLLG